MKLNRRDIRRLINEVLNEAPQQSTFDLRRELRDKFVNDHLLRYYKQLYPDKDINSIDDIRIPKHTPEAKEKGYSTSGSWGEYDWNDRALRYGKGMGRDDIPVIWFSLTGAKFGPGGLDSVIETMNKSTVKGSGYELARTRTSSNDPFSSYHGATDKSVTVLYLKKIQ